MPNTKLNSLRGEELKEIARLVAEEIKSTPKVIDKSVSDLQVETNGTPKPITEFGAVRPTGIPELDQLLHGGLPSDSTVLLAGASGTGKTILCMQWLFAGYEKYGEPGLYISLTEPVNKVIRNIEKFGFGKREDVTVGKVHIEDLRTIMSSLKMDTKELTIADLDTLIDKISDLMFATGAKRIVIDSITAIAYRLQDKHLIRTFIYHLDALLAQNNINVILTSEVVGRGFSVFGVEEFISDGIIKLSRRITKGERVNKIRIVKMRGTSYDTHPTTYRITDTGFTIYPRLVRELQYEISKNKLSTGVIGLDKMMNGGYVEGSSILITGSSGTGKSLLGLQFLQQGLKDNKSCLLVSFEESREQIIRNAEGFGWDLPAYEKSGNLKMITSYPEQKYLEEHVGIIIDEIEASGSKLLVIDSLSSLGNAFSSSLLRDFVSRLNGYLKERLITTIYTNATSTLLGANEITDAHLSTITDQIIMLRYVEISSELHHALLILKMRGSKHDKKLREINFGSTGLEISNEFSGLEGVLTGSTRKVSESIEEQIHDLFLEALGPMGEKIFEDEKQKGLSLESIGKMITDLGNQGIVSMRKKEEFLQRSSQVFK